MNYSLNCKGRLLTLEKPIVMGILNATPDSFYTKGKDSQPDMLLKKAASMLEAGATILDIGGMSTRPGAAIISEEEELSRVLPVIELIKKNYPDCYISIDTFRANVAREAVQAGADMINDVSGGLMDEGMFQTVAALNVSYILMHMQGTPQTMQHNPEYEDVVRDVLDYFIERTQKAERAGIKDIIVDPGFGFGKNQNHNYELLQNLNVFSMLEKPLLVGFSRKGMVYKPLNITSEEALNGTTVLNTIALVKGAKILRVHDVKEAMECIQLSQLLSNDTIIKQ